MTVSEILFGYGVHEAKNTKLADLFGVTRETVRKWRRDPGLVRLRDLQTIARVRRLNDEDILRVVRGRGDAADRKRYIREMSSGKKEEDDIHDEG